MKYFSLDFLFLDAVCEILGNNQCFHRDRSGVDSLHKTMLCPFFSQGTSNSKNIYVVSYYNFA